VNYACLNSDLQMPSIAYQYPWKRLLIPQQRVGFQESISVETSFIFVSQETCSVIIWFPKIHFYGNMFVTMLKNFVKFMLKSFYFYSDFTGKVHVFDADPHITSGYTATPGQFPWQVAITIDNSYFCGGSLISDDWVLTAAHCA
jgi:hypothetical protein